MLPNLVSTGFDLFRNSNLPTAHEHVANSYIDAYMYIWSPVYIHLLCLRWSQFPVVRNAKAR